MSTNERKVADRTPQSEARPEDLPARDETVADDAVKGGAIAPTVQDLRNTVGGIDTSPTVKQLGDVKGAIISPDVQR